MAKDFEHFLRCFLVKSTLSFENYLCISFSHLEKKGISKKGDLMIGSFCGG